MVAERKPQQRIRRVATITLLIVVGVGLPIYGAMTHPDREIVRLRGEIRKAGLAISKGGQPYMTFPELEAQAQQLLDLERPSFKTMTPTRKAQFMTDTDPIYQRLRAGRFGETQPYNGTRGQNIHFVSSYCHQRVFFYADSHPDRALDALSTLSKVAEHTGRQAETLGLTYYARAYEHCVARWIDKPDLLKRLDEVRGPEVDPMETLRISVDVLASGWEELNVSSRAPKELWRLISGYSKGRQVQRAYFEQVKTMLQKAESHTVLDLAKSVSDLEFAESPPHAEAGRIFRGISETLGYMAKAEVSRKQCEAYIEMHRTYPEASVLPRREPFIDPCSGEPFLIRRERNQLWVISVGPNGHFDRGDDDIVAKFKLRPANLP